MKKATILPTFFKNFICLLFLCFVLSLFIACNNDNDDNITILEVVGQDDQSVDIDAIQNAVDEYNQVMLIGTFDIGSEGSITLSKDVSIIGNVDENEHPATVIKGGTETFYVNDPKIKINISNIRFEGATFCAIRVRQCESVSITENEFVDIIAGENYGEQNDLYYDAVGIIVGGKRTEHANRQNILCSYVTISDNYFDMGEYDENGELVVRDDLEQRPTSSRAFRLYHCLLKHAEITANNVINYNRIAFDCLDAVGNDQYTAIIDIKFNNIESGPYAARGGWSETEVVGSSYAMHCIAGFSDPDNLNLVFNIEDNKIKTYSTNVNSYNMGIYLFPATSNSVIANNTFELGQSTNCGVLIAWLSSLSSPIENQPHDNTVRNNKFSGIVTAIVIPLPDGSGTSLLPGTGVFLFSTKNNLVSNNDFTELVLVPKYGEKTVAHVFLTGSNPSAGVYPSVNNHVSGSYGIIIDNTDDLTTPEYDGLNTYEGDLTVNGI